MQAIIGVKVEINYFIALDLINYNIELSLQSYF